MNNAIKYTTGQHYLKVVSRDNCCQAFAKQSYEVCMPHYRAYCRADCAYQHTLYLYIYAPFKIINLYCATIRNML